MWSLEKTTSKDKATPQPDDGLANNDALSDAEESDALILTRCTNSPRGTRGTLDLPMGERISFTKPLGKGWNRHRVPGWPVLSRSQENGGEQSGGFEHSSFIRRVR